MFNFVAPLVRNTSQGIVVQAREDGKAFAINNQSGRAVYENGTHTVWWNTHLQFQINETETIDVPYNTWLEVEGNKKLVKYVGSLFY